MGTQRDTIRVNLEIDDTKAQQDLKRFIDKLEADFKRLSRELTKALESGTTTNKQQQNIKRLTNEIDKAEKEIKTFKRSVDNAAKSVDKLGKEASQTSKETSGLGNGLKGVSTALSSVGNIASLIGFAGLAVGFQQLASAAIAFGDASLVAFQQFETGISEVRTLLPNLSDEGFGQLQDDVQAFALDIGRTTDDILPALYQALSAGIPQENVFEFLEVANQAAIAGVTTLETSVDALSSVVNAYGADVISASEVSDVFFTTIRLGKTTFEELAPVISQVTPIAANLGISFEEVGAAIATITATGVPTSQALTQIRAALVDLSEPTTVIAQAFEEITGQSFREFIAAGNDLGDAFQIVNQAANDTGLEFSELFGRIEASLAATVLATSGAEKFADSLTQLSEGAGATSDAAEQFNDTLAETERRTNAQTEALKLQVGEALAPAKQSWLELTGAIAEYTAETLDTINATSELAQVLQDANVRVTQGRGGSSFVSVLSDDLDEAGISTTQFESKLLELQETFEGTNSELVRAALELAKNEKALADVAQGAEVVTDRYTAYAESLGLTVGVTEEATQVTDELTGAYELTAEDLEQVAKNTALYEAEQRKLISTLVKSQEGIDDSTLAVFKQAEAAGVSSERLNSLAVTLGIVSKAQIDAANEQVSLANSLDAGVISEERFIARSRELASVLSNEVVTSALDAGAAIDSALAGASARIDEITSRRTGGGGGSRRSATDIQNELDTELKREEDARRDEVAALETELDDDITDLQKQNDADRTNEDKALKVQLDELDKKLENDTNALKLQNIEDRANLEKQFDEERASRLADFERQRGEEFLNQLENVQAEQPQERTAEEQAQDIIEQAVAGGATAEQAAEALVDAGVATAEQAQAALTEELRSRGEAGIAEALAKGILSPDQVEDAIASLNEQLAAGAEEIDLSEFGVKIRERADIELEIEEERLTALQELEDDFREAQEKLDLEALNARAEAQEKSAERITAINKKTADDIVKLQEAANARITKANEQSAQRIIKANERAAQAIIKAQQGGGRAIDETKKKATELAKQLLQMAKDISEDDEASLQQKRDLAELAFQELVNIGEITQAEADQEVARFILNETTAKLAQAQSDLNTAFEDGEDTLKDNQQTIDLFKSGLFDSTTNAAALASVLTEKQIPAFIDLANKGVPVRDILNDIGVNLDELPTDVQIAIGTNADEAITEIDDVNTALDELDGRVVNVDVNVQETNDATGGTGGATGGGQQAPGDAFMDGGHTGRGRDSDVAGIVHANELVVPASARKGGVAGIVQFALARDPDIATNTRRASPSIASSASFNPSIAPSVTNIDNSTRGGDTVSNTNTDNSSLTIQTGGENRTIRSVVDFEQLENANGLMRR